ncbi:lipopolysaccharide biosynthesis protein [Methylovirgula sp. 4M-Z18]|uniref:lipopolysaccharide biosynthesis protein n=1 Tax=Methylovirgula sp. 4M-Z18 TaxID=2293567 RepID=UPI001314A34F
MNVLRLFAQFFAVPILSRLLSPADYGLIGLASPFMFFAMMLADAGVGTSLVRHSADDHKAWSTCFWISSGMGFCAGIAMAGLAFVAAIFLNEPRLGPIVMALALVVCAQGMTSIPSAALQLSQRFQLIAGTEVAATLTGIGTAVVMALHGAGAWALVGQQLAFFAARLILVFSFSSFYPRWVFSWPHAKEHVLFGRDVLGVNFLGFFSRQMDNLVIGKALGSTPVGLYSMAFQFVRLPSMIITGPLQYVMYAHLSKIKDRTDAIRETFLLLTRSVALLIFPIMGMVAAAYKPVFDLMLSAKWEASAELFMLVAPAGALQAVTALGGTTMWVVGRSDIAMRTTFEFGVLWMTALLASVWFGIWWIAIAYDVVVMLYIPRAMHLMLPQIECSPRQYAQSLVSPLAITAVAILLFELVVRTAALSEWHELFIAGLIGVSAVGASGLLQRRQLMNGLQALNVAATAAS